MAQSSSQSDWSPQFKALLSSPLGVELLAELTKLADRLTEDARMEKTPDTAFGLLKESSGVINAIGHLHFLSVTPKDEGGQGN